MTFSCAAAPHWSQWGGQEGGHGETGKQQGAKYSGQAGRIWMDAGAEVEWPGGEGGGGLVGSGSLAGRRGYILFG